MDIEKIKSSGLLEQYVLGLLSPVEREKIDVLAAQHPALKSELNMLQQAMEEYANLHSVPPPTGLKKKIKDRINILEEESPRSIKVASTKPNNKIFKLFSGVAAAAIVGLLGLCYLLFDQQQSAKNRLAILEEKLNKIESSYTNLQSSKVQVETKFATLKDLGTHHVHLRGSGNAPNSLAVIYWNPDHKKGYLNVVEMPVAPHGHQYQIWADVNGKHLDMGLIDTIKGNSLVTIPFIENSKGFVITLEKEGGSQHPTVEKMYVKGEIEL